MYLLIITYQFNKQNLYFYCISHLLLLLRHARRKFFVPKLQYFLSFKYIYKYNPKSKTNNKFIT